MANGPTVKLFDPASEKAKDNARQRKIVSNSSDKASRRNAPLIKIRANRKIRRADHVLLGSMTSDNEEEAQAIAPQHKVKARTWGSMNAAKRRAERREEINALNETAGQLPKGRRRWQLLKLNQNNAGKEKD